MLDIIMELHHPMPTSASLVHCCRLALQFAIREHRNNKWNTSAVSGAKTSVLCPKPTELQRNVRFNLINLWTTFSAKSVFSNNGFDEIHFQHNVFGATFSATTVSAQGFR